MECQTLRQPFVSPFRQDYEKGSGLVRPPHTAYLNTSPSGIAWHCRKGFNKIAAFCVIPQLQDFLRYGGDQLEKLYSGYLSSLSTIPSL